MAAVLVANVYIAEDRRNVALDIVRIGGQESSHFRYTRTRENATSYRSLERQAFQSRIEDRETHRHAVPDEGYHPDWMGRVSRIAPGLVRGKRDATIEKEHLHVL